MLARKRGSFPQNFQCEKAKAAVPPMASARRVAAEAMMKLFTKNW
jgi:hypothetical protein